MSVPAQSSHPDFSGNWTLVPSPGVTPDAPLWTEGSITQDASSLSVASTVPSGSRVSFRLDGRDSEGLLCGLFGDCSTLVSHTKWEANALVITTTYHSQHGQWDDLTTLSLDASGNLGVVTDKTPKQPNVPRVVKQYTYRKH
jgi:hypothetical protein